ncbi:MAG TPA: hypothetical protein VGL66_07670 [Caulobacteraceae bacterium]
MHTARYGLGLVMGLMLPWLASAALAAEIPSQIYGAWVLKVGSRNLYVLTLKPGNTATLPVAGDFARPHGASISGNVYWNVEEPTTDVMIAESRYDNGRLHLTMTTTDGSGEADYEFILRADGTASLARNGADKTYYLTRGAPNAAVAQDWDRSVRYLADDSAAPEIQRLYDADQADRQVWATGGSTAGGAQKDADRREATRKLLADRALQSGEDYEEAANIFQHGKTPQDYLLAHTLAIVAVGKGDKHATWIAAATLDRYLLKVGQPQVYGTQFGEGARKQYDRATISDALRTELRVPTLDEQDKRN